MKLLRVFSKCLREQSRDILTLVLTLICAAFFVLLYKVMLPDSLFRCRIIVYAESQHADGAVRFLESIDAYVKSGEWKGKTPNISIQPVDDVEEARKLLRNRQADLLLWLEPEFFVSLFSSKEIPAPLFFEGDPALPQYQMGVILVSSAVEETLLARTGDQRRIVVQEHSLGIAGKMTRFENYVPGLLFVSIIILVFSVSIAVMREVESNTLSRLRMTHLKAAHFLGGYALAYTLLGIISIVITFVTAYALGFSSYGSVIHDLSVGVLVCALTSLSVIGIGLIVAAVARSTIQAFLISIFPVLLLLFFSGAFYPIPKIVLFEFKSIQIGLYDILPPTHAVNGMKKFLIYGSSLKELTYEFVSLCVLAVLYFASGLLIFRKRHF